MNYERELNKGMKVFSQLYVGLKDQSPGQPCLGFATPHENNAAGRKRQETVDTWSRGYCSYVNGVRVQNPVRFKIVANAPRPGFKITDDVKRVYWGGGNVVFRVFDPEGFELEIQSQNLMAIIQTAGINEGGVIPGNCVWGRSGKDNILLHEGSEEFKNAILSAETLKPIKQTATSERVAGTKYLLQDGSEGIYLGKFWVIRDNYTDLPNMGIYGAKIGKYTVQGKLQERKMGEPEAFDAVDVGDGERQMIKLYKKAPLIRSVESITEKTPAQCLNIVRSAYSISFASTSMSGRIAFIHNTKFPGYKYVTEKMRESVFKDRLRKILDHNNSYYIKNGLPKSAVSFSGFYGGYAADATIIVYKHSEKLYSSFLEMRRSGFLHSDNNVTIYHAGWPVAISDKVVSEFVVNQYALIGSYSGSQDHPNLIEGVQIPTFLTRAEIGEWFTQEYERGNLLEVCIQPMDYA